jgi:hypothetical protein
LSDSRLRTACLERGLLFHPFHDLAPARSPHLSLSSSPTPQPLSLKASLAALSASSTPPPGCFVSDLPEMRERLRRYLQAISVLSNAAHPEPLPPSLLLHLPLLLVH